MLASQKAPSAKRCIKTANMGVTGAKRMRPVRKHRAPKGALRLKNCGVNIDCETVSESTERQKVH